MQAATHRVSPLMSAAQRAATATVEKKATFFAALNYRSRMALLSVWAACVTVTSFIVSLFTWGHVVSGWLYARGLNILGMPILGVKIKVAGRENLPKQPAILLVNHQSNLDAFFLGGIFPWKSVVVAKKEMLKVPLFGITLKASRTIFVDREDSADAKRALKAAISAIKDDKNNIWIFPEGTRSKGEGLGEFKKGAFAMAIAAGAPIVPIVNQQMEHVLDTQKRILKGGKHHIKILPAISTEGLKFRDIDLLMASVRAQFEHELANF